MNRRAAIFSILGTTVVAFTGSVLFKFWTLYRKPEVAYLDDKKLLIAELADTIIPRTQTPGAKDAQVEDFIIRMIHDCTETRSQNRFISGLKDLEKYTLKTYKKDFISCNDTEKISILNHFENKEKLSALVYKIQYKIFGDSFIHLLKYFTVVGYCTSEIGATKGLVYDYIPGSFESCISLTTQQKCWATE